MASPRAVSIRIGVGAWRGCAGRRRGRPCPAASGRAPGCRTARASCSAMPAVAGCAAVTRKAGLAEIVRHHLGQPLVVFDQQDAIGHGFSLQQENGVEVYALGTIADPHPNLSPGEGKEPRKQGQYACGKCLFSFWYVKFCKVGGGPGRCRDRLWSRAPRKSPVSGCRQEHDNRIGRYEAGPSTRAAQDARLPRTQGRQRRGPALAARGGAGPTPPRPCTKRL